MTAIIKNFRGRLSKNGIIITQGPSNSIQIKAKAIERNMGLISMRRKPYGLMKTVSKFLPKNWMSHVIF
jgi:hypothetical protein